VTPRLSTGWRRITGAWFQYTDLSAHYESLYKQHGKEVVYTQIGLPGIRGQEVGCPEEM